MSKTCIYKYTSLKYMECAIKHGIYASKLENVNDPFENQGISYSNTFRICCLTTIPNNRLMWSHYADKHQGCSIQFGNLENYDNNVIHKVIYTKDYSNKIGLSFQQIQEKLYEKHKSWSREKEVRAVYSPTYSDPDHWNKIGDEIYFNAAVTCVNFGANSDNSDEYMDCLMYLRDYNNNHPKTQQIKVKKYILSPNSYNIILDNQFDYLREIEKIENKKTA